MDKQKLTSLEPFFDGWLLDNVIDQTENTTLYRVMRTSSDGGVNFRHLNVITVKAAPPHSDGELPEEVQMKLIPLEIMQKMKNCDKIVTYYDCRTEYLGGGEYAILSLRECVTPLSDEYDIHDLPTAAALKICISASEAVRQFRSMGITHENISLENIFIDSFGNFKLGSFANTGANDDCKAPEEYNNGDLSQSDMYALGMLLFKSLNHSRAPFLPDYPLEVNEENLSNALKRRLGGEIPSAGENFPSGTNKIIKRACAFKPSDRYQNLNSFKRDIEFVLTDIDPTYSTNTATVTGYAFGQAVPKSQREQFEDSSEITIKDEGGYSYGGNYQDHGEESGKIIKGLIIAIVAVAVISISLIAYSLMAPGREVEISTTTTTQPSASTTAPTVTQPVVTEPITTEPETTAPTTTEPTTPSVPSEQTTKPTMSTTVVTTTTKPTTTKAPTPEYVDIENPTLELMENDGRVEEILIFADAKFGARVQSNGEALLYEYDESGTIVKTHPVSFDCYYDMDHPNATICDLIVPSDIDIDTDTYHYELFIPKDAISGNDSKNEAFSVEF